MVVISSSIIGESDHEGNPNNVENWNRQYSNEWKDGLGTCNMLYRLAADYIEDGSSVLDIGGGIGDSIQVLLRERPNCNVTVLDISDEACEIGRGKYPNVKYIASEFLEWECNEVYDHITADEVLEHFDRPDIAMDKIMSLVKKDGTVTLGVPHEDQVYYWHQHRFSHESYHFFKQYSKWVSFSDDSPLTKDGDTSQVHIYVKLVKE